MSIHQPRSDIFELFHRVVLMAKGGRTVYCGDAASAEACLQAEAKAAIAENVGWRPSEDEAFLEASLHSMAEGSGEGGGAGGAEDDGDRHVDEAKSGNEELFENGGEATTSWGVDGRRAVRASRARASLNPGDVILDLACGLHATQLTTAFERSEGKAALATAIAELVRSSAGATATSANSVAWFHTQVLVLSQRLLRKAVRHPMLLTLHYGGSVFMAVTLGSIFADMHYDFDGAQDRIGVLFFILFYLALLGMSSLPVWRDEYLLFAHERASNIYGNLAYYLSIVLFDLLLIRVVPPFAFAFISYKWMNLQEYCEQCLYEFVLILVLANVTFALWSMGIGALRLSTVVSNVVGALVVMVFMLTGGFMVDRKTLQKDPFTNLVLFIDPMSYAFESLLINQFHAATTQDGEPLYYLINTTYCASSFPVISVSGDTILSTFNYATSHKQGNADVMSLVRIAAVLLVFIYLVLVWTGELSSKCRRFVARCFTPGARSAFGSAGNGPEKGLALSTTPPSSPRASEEARKPFTPKFPSNVSPHLPPPLPDDPFPDPDPAPLPCLSWSGPPRPNGRERSSFNGPTYELSREDGTFSFDGSDDGDLGVGPGAVLSWEDICLYVPALGCQGYRGEKQVIRSVSGVAGPLHVGSEDASEGMRNGNDDENDGDSASGGTHVAKGDMCALMGPSGAGKTSLLDILAGRKNQGRTTGTVRLNGRPLTPKQRRATSGYVVQEDILPATLTVIEHLQLHSQLRMGSHAPLAIKLNRAHDVAKELGLSSILHSPIGNDMQRGISGGEKRRVSIAVELLTRPPVLFLDEPTSGLDSTASINVVNIVSKIASRGTTVIMSIHQPRVDIFAKIRRVVLLAKGGHMAYIGEAERVGEYIGGLLVAQQHGPASGSSDGPFHGPGASGNPADLMLDVVTSLPRDEMVQHFRESTQMRRLRAQLERASSLGSGSADAGALAEKMQASFACQFRLLAIRNMRTALRDPMVLTMQVAAAAIVGVTLGLTFYDINQYNDGTAGIQDRLGLCFFILLYFSLMSLSSLPIWRDEQRIFIHERAAGAYCTGAYFSATIVCDLIPYRILPPVIFTAIAYPMIGLAGPGRWPVFMLTLVLYNLVTSALCMLIGLATTSNAVSNAAGR